MAERSSDSELSRGWIFYLLVTAGILIYLVGFSSPDWMESQIRKEQELFAVWYSHEMASGLIEDTNEVFEEWFVDSGAIEGLRNFVIPSEQERANSQGVEDLGSEAFAVVDRVLRAWWLMVYQTVMRLLLFVGWSIYLLPLVGAAIYDGYIRREIKQHTYGYSGPVRYRVAIGMLGWLIFLFTVYLAFPYTPSFAPLIPIATYVAIAVLVSWAASNLQKRI